MQTAQAQYDFAAGLRSGGTSGITIKRNYDYSALEGIIGFWSDGLSLTALWQRTTMAFRQPSLRWYYGVGAHVAVYGEEFEGKGGLSWYRHPQWDNDAKFGIGADLIVGLEYKVPNIPLAFSADLKPFAEIITNNEFIFFLDPGIGLKLAF